MRARDCHRQRSAVLGDDVRRSVQCECTFFRSCRVFQNLRDFKRSADRYDVPVFRKSQRPPAAERRQDRDGGNAEVCVEAEVGFIPLHEQPLRRLAGENRVAQRDKFAVWREGEIVDRFGAQRELRPTAELRQCEIIVGVKRQFSNGADLTDQDVAADAAAENDAPIVAQEHGVERRARAGSGGEVVVAQQLSIARECRVERPRRSQPHEREVLHRACAEDERRRAAQHDCAVRLHQYCVRHVLLVGKIHGGATVAAEGRVQRSILQQHRHSHVELLHAARRARQHDAVVIGQSERRSAVVEPAKVHRRPAIRVERWVERSVCQIARHGEVRAPIVQRPARDDDAPASIQRHGTRAVGSAEKVRRHRAADAEGRVERPVREIASEQEIAAVSAAFAHDEELAVRQRHHVARLLARSCE